MSLCRMELVFVLYGVGLCAVWSWALCRMVLVFVPYGVGTTSFSKEKVFVFWAFGTIWHWPYEQYIMTLLTDCTRACDHAM